jgi:hypothetical protein
VSVRRSVLAAVVIAAVLAGRVARAEHFDIRLLAAIPGGAMAQAFADQSPPAGGINPRPVLKAKVGDRITVQFIMTNVYPHEVARNAGVHYFVVREQTIGQKALPALTGDVVTEGRLVFDLKPEARIGTRQQIVIRRPGNDLLRVESERTQREHEHFAAMDLQIE